MESDKKDPNSPGDTENKDVFDIEIEGESPDEDEKILESLEIEDNDSATSLSAEMVGEIEDDYATDLDVDITGDEEVDFADDDGEGDAASGGGLKKFAAPALVLVAAAGVGGYIMMNPDILGGGGTAPVQSESSYVAMAGASSGPSGGAADSFAGDLPQPTVNQNTVPRGPDGSFGSDTADTTGADVAKQVAMVDDITEDPAGFGGAQIPESADTPAFPSAEAFQDISEAPSLPGDAPEEPASESLMDLYEAEAPAEVVEVTEMAAVDIQNDEGGGLDVDDPLFPQGSADPLENETEPDVPLSPVAEPEAVTDSSGDLLPFGSDPVSEPEPVVSAVSDSRAMPPPMDDVSDEGAFEIAQADTAMPEPLEPFEERAPARDVQPDVSTLTPIQGRADAPVTPLEAANTGPDVYFDGRVPTGPMANQVGPRKVDPVLEPSSKLVVVKKAHEASDMESMLVSANRALKLKRYDSALDIFEQLYDKNRRDPRILMGLAVAQQNSGRAESALRTYEELLDVKPNDPDATLNMLGIIRQQFPEVAARRLMDLYQRNPNNAGIAAQIGVTQADLGRYDDAMRYLGIASSLEPENAQHMFNMAVIADRQGETRTAIRYYEQALETDAIYSSGRTIARDAVYDRLAVLRRR